MTAQEHRKVVVRFTPELYPYEDRQLHAARIPGLGLSSYGHTPGEAVAGLDSIFRAFINGHRETGRLQRFSPAPGSIGSGLTSIPAITGTYPFPVTARPQGLRL